MENKPAIEAPQFAALLRDAVSKPGTISAAYSAFHGYSIGNQLLALWQCGARKIQPGPIATFPGWIAKGRHVKKGEKAIVLCQPVTIKKKGDKADSADKPECFTLFTYRAKWFVASQTDGAAPVEALAPQTWDRARALAALGIEEIPFTLLDGNCQGFAIKRSIAVSPIAALPEKTRFHELAHVVLGHTVEADMNDSDQTPRNMAEVEAECVALVCLEALGLDGADHCRGYVQHWNHGGHDIPERNAQRIFKAADQILKAGRPASDEQEN